VSKNYGTTIHLKDFSVNKKIRATHILWITLKKIGARSKRQEVKSFKRSMCEDQFNCGRNPDAEPK
jgi:hypothetical protein